MYKMNKITLYCYSFLYYQLRKDDKKGTASSPPDSEDPIVSEDPVISEGSTGTEDPTGTEDLDTPDNFETSEKPTIPIAPEDPEGPEKPTIPIAPSHPLPDPDFVEMSLEDYLAAIESGEITLMAPISPLEYAIQLHGISAFSVNAAEWRWDSVNERWKYWDGTQYCTNKWEFIDDYW